MSGYVLQVTVAATLLVLVRAQSLPSRGDSRFYPETRKFTIFNLDRSGGGDSAVPVARRELVVITVPRPQDRPAHIVSLENILGSNSAQRSPVNIAPSSAVPTWDPYQSNPAQPYFFAVEDFRSPAPIQPIQQGQQQTEKHFSLFDVKLAARPTIIVGSLPQSRDPNYVSLQDAGFIDASREADVKPPIDVRSVPTAQRVSKISSHSSSQDSRGSSVASTTPADANDGIRPYRSAEEAITGASSDPVIVFPSESDEQSVVGSVEVIDPFDRLRRNIVSLENGGVPPAQIAYPDPRSLGYDSLIVPQYRYLQYPQQYPVRSTPSFTNNLCPLGSCYQFQGLGQ